MKNNNLLKIVGLCLILGAMATACGAELNPNTGNNIYTALDAQKGAYKACYEDALKKDRKAQGDVKLKVQVDAESTQISGAEVTSSAIKNDKMSSCIEGATNGIEISEQPNVPVEGNYDLEFGFEE